MGRRNQKCSTTAIDSPAAIISQAVRWYFRFQLWRAVDEHGVELDILLQKRCDKAAAKRFFQRVLCFPVPRKIVTD